ncbi:MAG TPA: histidine kinase [Rugosimonospora sp.]
MDNLAPQATTLAELRRARARWDSLQRLRRPLAVVVAALVIVTVLRGHPAPGVQGRPLGVLIGLIALLGGGGAALASRRLSRAAQVGAFTVFFAGAATLLLVQPGGLGVLGLLVALGTAAARVSGRAGGVLVVAVLVLVVTARVVTDGGQLDVTVVNVIAVVTLYSVAVGARRLRDSNEQAELLLVDLAASRESQLRAAALAERQRLAREMHDVLAHSLSGLVVRLEGARVLATTTSCDPKLVEAIERGRELAKTGLDEARNAVGLLRGEDAPGPDDLAALAVDFQRDTGIACRLVTRGEGRDPGAQARMAIYRTAQEALTNVRKHADPGEVIIDLAHERTHIRLRVRDVGPPQRRVPAGRPATDGYGLTGMRERATLLGGTLTAAPTGDGFLVELDIPA